ncbi:MAG: hypothetical protein EWV40_05570 [Microcystis flos-aquae Mf_WU_F_19750830_S460]|uniref:Uncharacterized protein n=1 Tax=Microcystis flos-aquae Mf_WU_F_19750830_S460 TaxID=2486237 RepID=A0A552LXP8_9CHRO|nr:MAG: hypothetical protein EWV40_05570 [Microcystis flos-aquae Mf_WU_F_19750830_S460]
MRRGKRQEARGNSKGIGGDSANLKNKCFKCVKKVLKEYHQSASSVANSTHNLVTARKLIDSFSIFV